MRYDGEVITKISNIFASSFYGMRNQTSGYDPENLNPSVPLSLDALVYMLLMDSRKTSLFKTGCMLRLREVSYLANQQTMNFILKGRSAKKIVKAFLVKEYFTKKYENYNRLEETLLEIQTELKEE